MTPHWPYDKPQTSALLQRVYLFKINNYLVCSVRLLSEWRLSSVGPVREVGQVGCQGAARVVPRLWNSECTVNFVQPEGVAAPPPLFPASFAPKPACRLPLTGCLSLAAPRKYTERRVLQVPEGEDQQALERFGHCICPTRASMLDY